MDTAGGTDNDLGTLLEGLHVVADVGATDAGVALNLHEVTDGDNDLLDLLSKLTGGSEDQGLAGLDAGVDLLEDRDGEGGGLSGTGLGLGDNVVAYCLSVPRLFESSVKLENIPLMTGMMARCWIADGRSKP